MAPGPTPKSCPIRRCGLLTHDADGDLVVYDPDDDVVHTLNASARLVYECCDGLHGPADIVREMVTRFDVASEVAKPDVDRALTQLKELNLIQQVDPA